jgi:hypothetical protein
MAVLSLLGIFIEFSVFIYYLQACMRRFKFLAWLPIEIAKKIHVYAFQPVLQGIQRFGQEWKKAYCYKCLTETVYRVENINRHGGFISSRFQAPLESLKGRCPFHQTTILTVRKKRFDRDSLVVRNLRKFKKRKLLNCNY